MKAIFESFAQTTSISLFFVPSIGNSGGGGVQLLFGKSLSLRENYASRIHTRSLLSSFASLLTKNGS